jgi:two-component system, OmpR family, sensor histidine kinase ArlS
MFSNCRQKIDNIPVAVKVTLLYTLFITMISILALSFIIEYTGDLRISQEKIDLQKHVINIAKHVEPFANFDDGIYMIHYDREGDYIEGLFPSGFPDDIPFDEDDVQALHYERQNFLYYDMRLTGSKTHGEWLRGIVPVDHIYDGSRVMVRATRLALPFFFLITIAGGYYIIKRGFRPVEEISRTVRSIGEERDLSKRIKLSQGGDEIHQMAATFNEMLEKIEDAILREKRFSSDVSHELRTPVSIIMSESEYGKDYTTSIEEAKAGFTSIFTQSQRMSQLINQLLELARIHNPEDIPMLPFDVSALAAEIAAQTKAILAAANTGCRFTADVTPGLTLVGNAPLLRRAIMNLIENARKFTDNEIRFTLTQREEHIRFTVEDNGPGIAAAELPHIWNRLYQTDAARSSDRSGLGLGLALVQLITRAHGGKVWAESAPGQGSVFYLEL